MASGSTLDRNTVLEARKSLQPVRGRGWLGGFGNMLDKELGEWFHTRRWLVQVVVWLLLINGFLTLILFVLPKVDPQQPSSANPIPLDALGLTQFFSLAIQFGSIGMIILSQDEIIREKQTGTAAWMLSKPVSRQSFILTKLLANSIGGLVFILAIPAVIAFIEIAIAAQHGLALIPFLLGIGTALVGLLFYLTLTLMLGVFFEQRAPVLGIAFGVMFGAQIASAFVKQVSYVLPVSFNGIAVAAAQGTSLPAVGISQLACTAAWSVVFTLIALWRFQKLEF
jgi:ABC-2 type transport system permease protein